MHLATKLLPIALLLTAPRVYGERIAPEAVVARIEELGGSVGMHLDSSGGPGPSRHTNQVESANLSGHRTGDKVGISDLRLVGTLTSLKHLHLRGTPTTNVGVYHLYRLTNLETLDLHDTPITDAALEALGGMNKMESLFLEKTRISSAGLKYLSRMTNLKLLYVGETNVGSLECLAQFPQLQKVNLSGTRVRDNDLQHLANLPNLEWLMLQDTDISDQGLGYLARCRHLTQLDLRKTRVSVEGANTLRKGLPQCHVYHVRQRTY